MSYGMSRPFRAGLFSTPKTQGFTLGYHLTPLQGWTRELAYFLNFNRSISLP